MTAYFRNSDGILIPVVNPGNIFLIQKAADDWIHTGIITSVSLMHLKRLQQYKTTAHATVTPG